MSKALDQQAYGRALRRTAQACGMTIAEFRQGFEPGGVITDKWLEAMERLCARSDRCTYCYQLLGDPPHLQGGDRSD